MYNGENMLEKQILDGKLVFIFNGKLDSAACIELTQKVEEGLTGNELQVAFDLKTVSFVSSAFIRICVQTAKTVGAKNYSIINTTPNIKKVFKISGLDSAYKID